jgi:carboxyl-terminal processing protease
MVGGKASDADLSQFWAVWSILQDNFVQTHASNTLPTDQKKIYGAIRGLTESYGDPYTVFFPPADAQVFNENVNGSFGGVGMELGQKDGAITVVAPLKGSPAEAAGIKTGDKVVMIEATSTDGMAIDEAVKFIRGPKGASVKLTLVRAGVAQPIVVSIVRDTINVPIIDTKDSGGVFTIALYSFSPDSPAQFRDALRQYFKSGDTKLVLDLRGDPGGYLQAAVEIASYFLPVGDTIVTEDTRGHGDNTVHRSLGYNVFAGKKLSMAILVDQGSASASEILAGALQQHNVGKLVGTRSFGKGSVQQLVDLGGGAELKVTIARWLTPNGTSISDGGLTPDIKADRTDTDRAAGKDPQYDAAVSWLATQ